MRGARSSAPLYLLVLCIGLAWLVYWQIEYPPYLSDAVVSLDQPVEPGPPGSAQAEFALPPLEDFSEIVARPLFSPTRRPPSEAEVIETVTDDTPLPKLSDFNLTLTGVVISTEGSMALLQRPKSTDLIRALLGQEIDGWRVERIEADRVTFRQGHSVEIVTLQDKAAEPTAQQ